MATTFFDDLQQQPIDTSFVREEKSPVMGNGWKMLYFKITIVVCFAIVFLTLLNLQIVKGAQFKEASDSNTLEVVPIVAPRGIIYDRNGVPLVYNQDTFKAVIDTNIFQSSEEKSAFPKLARVLNIPEDKIIALYNQGVSEFQSAIVIQDNISRDQMIEITTDPTLKGISAQPSVVRVYPYGAAVASILGYVGQVTADDVKTNPTLQDQDTIGKDGIELAYDKQLRGTDGKDILEVDTTGHIVSTVEEQAPIPGDNVTLSIDINVQKQLAADLAQGLKDSSATGGAAIIENVNDGSIIGMQTSPTYDNNLFAQGISEKQYMALVNDPSSPLLNRAIAGAYPPGSVMKTITGSAALQEGAITPDTSFYSGGTFDYGGHTFQDYDRIVRGNLTIDGGLQWSSNIFFYNTILKLGIDKFLKYEKLFGVGSTTGIDLPGELPGQASSPLVKQELTGQVWYGGDSLNAAIGQGYTLVTPIQVVNWITSIANNGSLFIPHIAQKVQTPANQTMQTFNANVLRQGFVSPQNLSVIRQGMHDAVHQGIDINLNASAVDVAGKTGTAETGALNANGQYTHEHAWASGFAPYNKPQIGFVFMLENGGLSTSAERVAKSFLNWYYGIYLKSSPGIL